MTDETIKPGDIVELKSGGPYMTVKTIDDGGAWCEWFDGNKPEGRRFATITLIHKAKR